MERLFSTRQRLKILRAVIFSEQLISVSNIAAKCKLSKGLVSKYFDILAKSKIAGKSLGKFRIIDAALTRSVKVLLNVAAIDVSIFRRFDYVEAAGLYGSCARGENGEDSDMDIWIKIKNVSDEQKAPLIETIQSRLPKAKVVLLTNEKLEKLREDDVLYYHSLAFGSIRLYGGDDVLHV